MLPVIGFLLTVYLWFSLSKLTLVVGLIWLGVGLLWLLLVTRGFRARRRCSTWRSSAQTMKAADDFVTAEGSHYATVKFREQQRGQPEGDDDVDHGRASRTPRSAAIPPRADPSARTPGRCDERQDQEPGAQVVDDRDVRPCPSRRRLQIQVPMTEAAMKPSTNLGNRPQNSPRLGRACARVGLALHPQREVRGQRDRDEADQAFWVVLTIVAICSASSPAIAPAAATAAVVSMLPPIQAPATASDEPEHVGEPGQQEDRRQREDDHQAAA